MFGLAPTGELKYGHLAASPLKIYRASRVYRSLSSRNLQLPEDPTGKRVEREHNSQRFSRTGATVTAMATGISSGDAVAGRQRKYSPASRDIRKPCDAAGRAAFLR